MFFLFYMEKPIQQKQKAGIVTSLNDTTLTKAGDIRKIRHSSPGYTLLHIIRGNLQFLYF